jgi:hypothetical protein
MKIKQGASSPKLTYIVGRSKSNTNVFFISRNSIDEMQTDDIGEFIYLFEKDMTIELQKIRSDLYFMHAAAVEYQGAGIILTAPSGTGKSTTSWALIHSGFRYLSDELAPIDLTNMNVCPYPHALNLKSKPPVYALPENTIQTETTLHIPIHEAGQWLLQKTPVPVSTIFFLEYDSERTRPEIKPISKSLATAKIYANTLNALNHQNKGMDAALSIASRLHCFDLITTDLEETCTAIKSTLDDY